MRGRNIYKDIVWFAVFYVLAAAVLRWGTAYAKEGNTYGFQIWAAGDFKEEMVEEFRKFSGICRFVPTETVAVTVRIGTYSAETEVMGLDFGQYPIGWEKLSDLQAFGAAEGNQYALDETDGPAVQEERAGTIKLAMGNTPLLFFGKEAFTEFADQGGYAPLDSQVEKWIQGYQTLDVAVTDENGRERKARICGILAKPGNKICMDKRQMKEVFGNCLHSNGGFLEIYGYNNTIKARRLLEDAGFITEESTETDLQ